MLLESLPSEYENSCIAIKSRNEMSCIEALKSKLIEKETRQNDKVTQDDTQNNALITKDKINRNAESSKRGKLNKLKSRKCDGKCFKCNKVGHQSRDCKPKSKGYFLNKTDDALLAISCIEMSKSNIWCLDSGAINHMCNDRQQFSELDKSVHRHVNTVNTRNIAWNQ